MNEPSQNLVGDLTHMARGLLMGAADVIPGVSGGTVALIVGIYVCLVTAISRFDFTFIGHLGHGRWKASADHVDLRFLVALGLGIVTGIVIFAVHETGQTKVRHFRNAVGCDQNISRLDVAMNQSRVMCML